MSADKKTMNDIHAKLAKHYLTLLDGSPEQLAQLSPAMLANIGKFLKDNGIEALDVPESPMDKIKGKLHLLKDYLEPHEREAVGE